MTQSKKNRSARSRSSKRHSHKGGSGGAAGFMLQAAGNGTDQFNNVFKSQHAPANHGNVIVPKVGGGKKNRKHCGSNHAYGTHSKSKTGGGIGAILYNAVPSALLLGMGLYHNRNGKSSPKSSTKKHVSFKKTHTRRR